MPLTDDQMILEETRRQDGNKFLKRGIKSPPDCMKDFYTLYFAGYNIVQAGNLMGLSGSRARSEYCKGRNLLQRWMAAAKEERQAIGVDEILSMGIRHTGLKAYKN